MKTNNIILQDLGYKGEIGYQTFLYANEGDLRKLLIFLLEKLPKESSVAAEEPGGEKERVLSLL